MSLEPPEAKNARNRASWLRRKLTDPNWTPRVRGEVPAVWDESVLTERWEDRKARLARERPMSAERVELSKHARRLLERLAVQEVPCMPRSMAPSELRRAGYADWNDRAGTRTWWLRITDAGRAALAGDRS